MLRTSNATKPGKTTQGRHKHALHYTILQKGLVTKLLLPCRYGRGSHIARAREQTFIQQRSAQHQPLELTAVAQVVPMQKNVRNAGMEEVQSEQLLPAAACIAAIVITPQRTGETNSQPTRIVSPGNLC
jgi:hypothetical protein